MSATVWSVAMAIHRGMLEVLQGFQNLGVDVRRLDDQVDDDAIDRLAGYYGRRSLVIPLLSTAYMDSLDEPYHFEDLGRYLPSFIKKGTMLTGSMADRVLWTIRQAGDAERIQSNMPKCKVPKAVRGIQLVGNIRNGRIYTNEDFQLFLIRQKKGTPVHVRFCLGSSFVLEVDVDSDPDQCMILVYADGKYIYEPAEFVKIKDVYYFDAPHYLEKRGISMPPLMSWFPSKSNFIGVVRWLMPSKNGFVLQTANVCEMRFDCEKLSLCHGSIQKIIWRANTEKQTIKGRAAVRHSADALLSLQGEIGAEKLQSCFNDLVESFYPKMGGFIGEGIGDCFELPGLYIKTAEKTYRGWLERKSASQILEEFLGDHPECAMMKNDDGTEKDVVTESEPDDLANMIADFNEQEREAYERLRLLEAQGLSSVPAQNFAKNKTLSISKGYGAGNLRPLQEDGCIRKIRAFEKTFQAVAYLCILSKSVFGRLLTVFYVSNQPDEWQTDRQWLSEKNPVVYVINLDDEDIADIGGIRYRISRGGIVRVE